MIRKVTPWLTGILMGAGVVVLLYDNMAAEATGIETYRQLSIFGDVFQRVRSQYVEEPEEKELIKNAINGMLSSLDPHSSYLTADEFEKMQTNTRGEFGGLGIEVTMDDGLVRVIAPIDDTPAAKAGVLAGDLIIKIDGENVRGLTLNQAVEKMRGPVNTPIVITIRRKGSDKPIELTIIRAIIKIRSVHYRLEGDDIGYIRIAGFSEQTFHGLKKAVEAIGKEAGRKLQGIILDLRLNPGGLLDQAVSVSDAFLDRGEIVSTRGRNPDEVRRYSARPGDLINSIPLIVLINGGSASASEIVAGALQDHERATILGTRSFGKGSVQTIIPLGPNGALRMTTALYYTPSGFSIQGKGIMPDIKVDQPLPNDLKGKVEPHGESELRGHITGVNEDEEGSGSIIYVPPDQKDDVQLNYAIDLLRGEKKQAISLPDSGQGSPEKKE